MKAMIQTSVVPRDSFLKKNARPARPVAACGAALLFLLMFSLVSANLAAQTPQPQKSSPSSAAAPQDNSSGQSQSAQSQAAGQSVQPVASPQPPHESIGRELATETREAEGDEDQATKLKHSAVVGKLGKLLGLDVHSASLLSLCLNFAIIAFVIIWFARKYLPAVFRARNTSIRRALEEARAASQEAGQRLTEIENRLRQMDAEISHMRASAEKEAEGEEARIKQAAEGDLRKIVESAEQEIAAAAKLVRRELSVHTADLALALARKQIRVDADTDQVLVRDFAAKLTANAGTEGNGGKDGR